MAEAARDRILDAIQVWMGSLENQPGRKEWLRKRFTHTLYFDDPYLLKNQKLNEDFVFEEEMEKEHDIIMQYFDLQQAINCLKDCEHYFRIYPFRDFSVTRYNHITNICEMYFSKFYEFKEKMKKYFKAVTVVAPNHGFEVGKFIKIFEGAFDQELRARNGVHHDSRFEDIAIDRIFLTEAIALNNQNKSWKRQHMIAYRKAADEWAQRVRVSGAKMDGFLETIANVTLSTCTFLKPSQRHG